MKSVEETNPEGAKAASPVTAVKALTKAVTKKDGRVEDFSLEKLKKRIDQLSEGLETKYMGLDACVKKVSAYAHSGKSNHFFVDSTMPLSVL